MPALAENAKLYFSSQPSEAEIFNARVFDEPIIPLGGSPTLEETKSLAAALSGYSTRSNLDDFSTLTEFLSRFPDSPWSGSLLLHLGTEYYNYGYYSEALNAWEQACQKTQKVSDTKGKAQADRALGELARMYSKLGRMHELNSLLDSTRNRTLSGPGTQLIGTAKGALWMMQHHPEVSFKCGPAALDQIRSFHNPKLAGNLLLEKAVSTTNGCSLAYVAALSRQLSMNYQAAFRSPGAPIVFPAVIHWKVGHYAAVLDCDGDRYLVKDYTFQSSLWMSAAALNEEASGYFLIPSGTLSHGWRSVSDAESQNVWGRGNVAGQQPGYCTPFDTLAGCGDQGMTPIPASLPELTTGEKLSPMTTYRMHAMLVSLNLNDRPVGYRPPVGPAAYFVARYNQQDGGQPATFYYSNLGPKWTCNWISYITDNPGSPGANVTWYVNGGGTLTFMGFNSANQTYQPELMSQAQLTKTGAASYEMLLADGSKQEFTMSDGSTGSSRRIFLTQIIDPAGNPLTLNYDSSLRITNVVDAIGQKTTLSYTNTVFTNAITAVSDPFGRTAYFQYNSAGLLVSITDILGIMSQYVYGESDFIFQLTTPYGSTTFTSGITNGVTFLQATDPLGESERLEFNQSAPIADSELTSVVPAGMGTFNFYLSYRDCYFWSKKAFSDGAGDYTKAKIYHWAHWPTGSATSPVLESEKQPLENRVWFDYPNEQYSVTANFGIINKPSTIGRVLDDGTTQQYFYQYNVLGKVINAVDPLGRNFTYVYSTNNVDLLQTVMTHNGKNELQSSATYNAQHLPLTITDAAGQTTTNTYNARGQILSTSNPKGELTTFGYTTNGYLLTVTGHLQTSNDVTNFTYDAFGRVRTVSDTEGYTLTFAYDAMDRRTNVTFPDGTTQQFVYSNLDLVASCDRLGRWTTNTYNADRQLVQTRDPLGRITGYDWCRCGALTGLTDPMGRTTTWDYDVESRPTAKHYADGSTITYVYETTTSRLKFRFDEKSQETFYEYYGDDTLKRISYPNATITTPTVTFTYDPDYNRVLTMQDGIGTTIYAYNPINVIPALGAGQLASANGPLPNSLVTYQYDQLSRATNRVINGVAQTLAYDVLDRPAMVTNALGTFQYAYVDATTRLASEIYPNGQTNLYTYYGNIGDERLLQIQHLYPNGQLLSGFGYAYNSIGNITAWTNKWDTLPTRVWAPTYDAADQLTNIVDYGDVSGVTNYSYSYDPAGNRLLEATNGVENTFVYNALNQLTSSTLRANSVTYEWDAENRLTAINSGTNRSEFYYDGFGRRIEIIEKTNGIVATNSFYLWCGSEICDQRNSTGANVTKRFFAQGEQDSGQCYFYTRDHLDSVREAVDSNGNMAMRHDYNPYGSQEIFSQAIASTFGFSGNFYHSPSGFTLTLFRVLNTEAGVWLSRDPIFQRTGVSQYVYADSNPLTKIDKLGLQTAEPSSSSAQSQAQSPDGCPIWRPPPARPTHPGPWTDQDYKEQNDWDSYNRNRNSCRDKLGLDPEF